MKNKWLMIPSFAMMLSIVGCNTDDTVYYNSPEDLIKNRVLDRVSAVFDDRYRMTDKYDIITEGIKEIEYFEKTEKIQKTNDRYVGFEMCSLVTKKQALFNTYFIVREDGFIGGNLSGYFKVSSRITKSIIDKLYDEREDAEKEYYEVKETVSNLTNFFGEMKNQICGVSYDYTYDPTKYPNRFNKGFFDDGTILGELEKIEYTEVDAPSDSFYLDRSLTYFPYHYYDDGILRFGIEYRGDDNAWWFLRFNEEKNMACLYFSGFIKDSFNVEVRTETFYSVSPEAVNAIYEKVQLKGESAENHD